MEVAARIVGVGEAALLTESLLGLISFRECPGQYLSTHLSMCRDSSAPRKMVLPEVWL
jgi:hypothetical protein